MSTGATTVTVDGALAHALRLLDQDPANAARQAREVLKSAPGHPGAVLLLGMVFEEVVESGAEFTHWLHSDGHTYWVASLSP